MDPVYLFLLYCKLHDTITYICTGRLASYQKRVGGNKIFYTSKKISAL